MPITPARVGYGHGEKPQGPLLPPKRLLAGEPLAPHPTPNRAGWHCRALFYVPRGLNLAPSLPSVRGSDLSSFNRSCARRGGEVAPPLGVIKEEVVVPVVIARWHCRAVGAVVRRAVADEVPGAVEEEKGPTAVRLVPQGILASGCAACTCPCYAWHRRCSRKRGSAPGRER